jgi:hypothetical protein
VTKLYFANLEVIEEGLIGGCSKQAVRPVALVQWAYLEPEIVNILIYRLTGNDLVFVK